MIFDVHDILHVIEPYKNEKENVKRCKHINTYNCIVTQIYVREERGEFVFPWPSKLTTHFFLNILYKIIYLFKKMIEICSNVNQFCLCAASSRYVAVILPFWSYAQMSLQQ